VNYREENSQCISNMQVKYAVRGLTATRLSQSSGIERYIDLFLTNVGHDPNAENVPAAAMDYNIAALIIFFLLMHMMYYDTTFIEGLGIFGTIVMVINLCCNYFFMKNDAAKTTLHNVSCAGIVVVVPGSSLIGLIKVLLAIQVGQAGQLTLASTNEFSNNCFRDALIISVIVSVMPYTIACFLSSNWEKFIVSQMSEMEDRNKYWAAGGMDTGMKNTRNTVHVTSAAIFGTHQLAAIFLLMVYFLSTTTIRMLVSFRALVRTFQDQYASQLATT
ncbi:hypothetical protein PMAYCL1PPCAC_26257, partial [Pristionchus mayeri]